MGPKQLLEFHLTHWWDIFWGDTIMAKIIKCIDNINSSISACHLLVSNLFDMPCFLQSTNEVNGAHNGVGWEIINQLMIRWTYHVWQGY